MSDLSRDDLSSDATALLDAARGGFDPPEGAKPRMRRGVAAAIGLATGVVATGAAATTSATTTSLATTAATTTATTAATTTATTAAIGGSVTGALGSGIAASLATKIVVGVAIATSLVGGAAVVSRNAQAPLAVTPAVRPQAGSQAGSQAGLQAGSQASFAAAPPPAMSTPSPNALSALPVPSTHASPASQRVILPRPGPASEAVSQAAPASAGHLASEAEMLRSALAAPPSEALKILDTHDQRFPQGALTQEGDAQRIVVLCQLGRVAEARASYARFVSAFPTSIHRARLDRSCAVGPVVRTLVP